MATFKISMLQASLLAAVVLCTPSCNQLQSNTTSDGFPNKSLYEPEQPEAEYQRLQSGYDISKKLNYRYFEPGRWKRYDDGKIVDEQYLRLIKNAFAFWNTAEDVKTVYRGTALRCMKQTCRLYKGKKLMATFQINGPDELTVTQSAVFRFHRTVKTAKGMRKKAATVKLPFVKFVRVHRELQLLKTIRGRLSAKSIQHNGQGLFFAQNMYYRRSINVYNRDFERVTIIPDQIDVGSYGLEKYPASVYGDAVAGPVEADFSHNGKYAWVTMYRMKGKGFNPKRKGHDHCVAGEDLDNSFVYKINTSNFEIERIVEAGVTPKWITVSRDSRYAFVSNWCSYDLSVLDLEQHKEIRRIKLAAHPRDSVVDYKRNRLYISIMGRRKVGVIDMDTWKVIRWIKTGGGPRHISLDPAGRYMYVSVKWTSRLLKIDLDTFKITARLNKGPIDGPASMEITPDGRYLYMVNYYGGTVTKVRASDFKVVKKVKARYHPVGLTYDALTGRVWVSTYSGFVLVYQG